MVERDPPVQPRSTNQTAHPRAYFEVGGGGSGSNRARSLNKRLEFDWESRDGSRVFKAFDGPVPHGEWLERVIGRSWAAKNWRVEARNSGGADS